jgi:MraZ protein
MLLGTHEHTVDEKNRLTLPARFREAFADGVVLTRGMDGCVSVYTRAAWDQLVSVRLIELDPFTQEARQMNRFIYAGASDADLDRQGRVVLPQALIEHAGLEREVIVAGLRDHLEIWDSSAWTTQMEEVERNAERVAQRLATDE